MEFIKRLFQEYPIPQVLSIWGTDDVGIGISLDDLIEMTLDDYSSDLEIYETVQSTGIRTQLPESTRAVTAVKLLVPFQGNRYVKWTFDADTKTCMLRYFPAKISYKRGVTLEDLNTLKGARLVYIKCAVLERMSMKEYSYLSTVRLESDAAGVNLDALKAFHDSMQAKLDVLKEDIMLYSNG